jgi:hypothetical protein
VSSRGGASRSGKNGKAAPWQPSPRQQRFLDMAVDFACRGKRLVLKEIALACGFEETRPSKWNSLPEFRAALAGALQSTHAHLREAARTALYQSAINGNLAAWDRIREVERDIEGLTRAAESGGAAPSAAAMATSGVHVHIHGIPEREPFSSLPPRAAVPAPLPAPQTSAPAK